jgi:hypothetical protein
MGHGKSLGSFEKQNPMSTSKNKDINNKSKLSKLSNVNGAIEVSTLLHREQLSM